jgi:hypothetical protein
LTPLSALVGLKDEHVAWRAAGIRRLDDDGTVRRQAASPLPAFDDLVDVAANAVRSAQRGDVVVADHGLGEFADALASRAGGTSLAPVLRRAHEVLVPGGRLCMIGLVAADEERTSPRSLTVSSLDRLRTELARANFSEPQCALASAELGEWMMIESALAGPIADHDDADVAALVVLAAERDPAAPRLTGEDRHRSAELEIRLRQQLGGARYDGIAAGVSGLERVDVLKRALDALDHLRPC